MPTLPQHPQFDAYRAFLCRAEYIVQRRVSAGTVHGHTVGGGDLEISRSLNASSPEEAASLDAPLLHPSGSSGSTTPQGGAITSTTVVDNTHAAQLARELSFARFVESNTFDDKAQHWPWIMMFMPLIGIACTLSVPLGGVDEWRPSTISPWFFLIFQFVYGLLTFVPTNIFMSIVLPGMSVKGMYFLLGTLIYTVVCCYFAYYAWGMGQHEDGDLSYTTGVFVGVSLTVLSGFFYAHVVTKALAKSRWRHGRAVRSGHRNYGLTMPVSSPAHQSAEETEMQEQQQQQQEEEEEAEDVDVQCTAGDVWVFADEDTYESDLEEGEEEEEADNTTGATSSTQQTKKNKTEMQDETPVSTWRARSDRRHGMNELDKDRRTRLKVGCVTVGVLSPRLVRCYEHCSPYARAWAGAACIYAQMIAFIFCQWFTHSFTNSESNSRSIALYLFFVTFLQVVRFFATRLGRWVDRKVRTGRVSVEIIVEVALQSFYYIFYRNLFTHVTSYALFFQLKSLHVVTDVALYAFRLTRTYHASTTHLQECVSPLTLCRHAFSDHSSLQVFTRRVLLDFGLRVIVSVVSATTFLASFCLLRYGYNGHAFRYFSEIETFEFERVVIFTCMAVIIEGVTFLIVHKLSRYLLDVEAFYPVQTLVSSRLIYSLHFAGIMCHVATDVFLARLKVHSLNT